MVFRKWIYLYRKEHFFYPEGQFTCLQSITEKKKKKKWGRGAQYDPRLTKQLIVARLRCKRAFSFVFLIKSEAIAREGSTSLPGGVLPYMGYTGMCRWIGYGFWPLCPEQGI